MLKLLTNVTELMDKTCLQSAIEFQQMQNEAMLHYLFERQYQSLTTILPVAAELIARDHGSYSAFMTEVLLWDATNECDWIVWGLSFYDNRFHTFGLGGGEKLQAFCVSPILVFRCISAEGEAEPLSVIEQLSRVDWGVVENRLECLQAPLVLHDVGASKCGCGGN